MMTRLNGRLDRIAKLIPPFQCPHCGLKLSEDIGPRWPDLLRLATETELEELEHLHGLVDSLRARWANGRREPSCD